jgi:methyl-accepting chemotaxis protein
MNGASELVDRIRGSYAAKLALALVAVVGLTVGFGAIVHVQTAEELREDVEGELTTTAEVRSADLDTWLSAVKKQTAVTSDHPVFRSGDEARIRSHVDDIVSEGKAPDGVVAVHYYDVDAGRIVTSSNEQLIGVSPREMGAPFAQSEGAMSFDGPNDAFVSAPFRVPVVDFPVVAVVSPVPDRPDRAVVYMVNFAQRTEAFTTAVDGGRTVVLDREGQFIAHPDGDRIMTEYGRADEVVGERTYADHGDTLVAAAPMESVDWTVLVMAPEDEALALGTQVTSQILGLILLTVVSLALVGVTVGSNTVISLRELSGKATAMAEGDLSVSMETDRRDELGTLYRTFGEMRDSLRETIEETQARNDHIESKATAYGSVMRTVAEGDLTRRVDPESENDAMTEIGTAFNGMLDELEATLGDVKHFAAHVSTASEEVDASAEEVIEASAEVTDSVAEISDGTARQSDRLQEVAGEMNTLSASAEEIAATVESAVETSRRAASAGADGRDAAEDAIEEMDAVERETEATRAELETLDREMEAIGEIVEVITNVAKQTNLLALNASIEAARTGAGGEGFAVVADEIKNLAEETQTSATEIEDRIEEIQARTAATVEGMHDTTERLSAGVETVEEAIDALERIVEHVDETDSSIREINRATDSQASSASSATEMVDEVAEIGQRTSTEAERVATAAEQQTAELTAVNDAAEDLARRATSLRSVLADFTVSDGATTDTAVPSARGGADSGSVAAADGGAATDDGDSGIGRPRMDDRETGGDEA